MTKQNIKEKIMDALEDKEDVMFCAVDGCGEIDETFMAYCIKHGRSTHKMKKVKRKYKK